MSREPASSQTGAIRVESMTDAVKPAIEPRGSYLRFFKSNVFVRDHDRSLKFYVDQLGFSVVHSGLDETWGTRGLEAEAEIEIDDAVAGLG